MPLPQHHQGRSLVRRRFSRLAPQMPLQRASNGLVTPPAFSTSSAASNASGASTAVTTPASTPLKPKVDVSALFRGSSSTNMQSPVTPSMSEIVSSPPMRSQTLSPQVHNLPLAPSGPAGPSPLSHSQPPPGSQPPSQMYPHAPFVPQNMRQQSNVSMANAPRSPGFQRSMTNGVGPAGGRPPVNVQSGPNNAGMPSPRVGPQTHHQPMPQNQMQQQHPIQPVGGVPPGMPPNMRPMTYPGWSGYYVSRSRVQVVFSCPLMFYSIILSLVQNTKCILNNGIILSIMFPAPRNHLPYILQTCPFRPANNQRLFKHPRLRPPIFPHLSRRRVSIPQLARSFLEVKAESGLLTLPATK